MTLNNANIFSSDAKHHNYLNGNNVLKVWTITKIAIFHEIGHRELNCNNRNFTNYKNVLYKRLGNNPKIARL